MALGEGGNRKFREPTPGLVGEIKIKFSRKSWRLVEGIVNLGGIKFWVLKKKA